MFMMWMDRGLQDKFRLRTRQQLCGFIPEQNDADGRTVEVMDSKLI